MLDKQGQYLSLPPLKENTMDWNTIDTVDIKNVSEQQFRAYQKVQNKGHWNMIMEAGNAMKEAGLDAETYLAIIKNYGKLLEKFGKI